MNIDLGSLFFNASLQSSGGGTPSWGTALGQSAPDYKLTYPGSAEILLAMDFCYYPLSDAVSCKLGKGGREYKAIESQAVDSKFEIIKAALFKKVSIKVDDRIIPIEKPFALLVTKENESTHKGRKSLKYSDSISLGDNKNTDFFAAVTQALGGGDVCWFAYAIDVKNQDALQISVAKVGDHSAQYQNAEARKSSWLELMPPGYSASFKKEKEINDYNKEEFIKWLNNPQNCESQEDDYKKHLVNVLEKWLDQKIDDEEIGNLFRFSHADEFKKEKERIFALPSFNSISDADQSGRPKAALNHYEKFLLSRMSTPAQIIYYGVPGSGKSRQIQEDLKIKGITEENHQQKRVVFHPDYCNADFVGQILPVTKKGGGILYRFKAGPFTKILRDAYENPTKEYALIIEEINRGNAAAIFGDLFQLLDRKHENDPIETINGNSYGPGWSEYCVENDYINAYFRGAYDSEEVPDRLPSKKLGNIEFNDNVDIRLPPNFSIYATMNTSDQNVFTLDNAFQRRWEMKQISNDLAHGDPAADTTKQYDQIIGSSSVKWGVFREAINDIIMQSAEESGLSSMEDKRLGGWFIIPKKVEHSEEVKITDEAFAEKVLKYLWDDAFKFDRPKHFGKIKTLEDLTKKFKEDHFKVFEDDSIKNLQQGTTPPTANNDDPVDTPANDPTQNGSNG